MLLLLLIVPLGGGPGLKLIKRKCGVLSCFIHFGSVSVVSTVN